MQSDSTYLLNLLYLSEEELLALEVPELFHFSVGIGLIVSLFALFS